MDQNYINANYTYEFILSDIALTGINCCSQSTHSEMKIRFWVDDCKWNAPSLKDHT